MNLEKDTICMDKKFYLDNIQHFKKIILITHTDS